MTTIEKQINILNILLSIDYQREALFELAIQNYQHTDFDINESKLGVFLENDIYQIFVLPILTQKISKSIKRELKSSASKKQYIITLDETGKNVSAANIIKINSIDWMNKIIDFGINKQILNLKFIRDFHTNNCQ